MTDDSVEFSPTHRTLESYSLWYKYKTVVWRKGSPESVTVHNTMRTLRAIRQRNPLAYISAPITSGIKFYDLQLERQNIDEQELMRAVIAHNYHQGYELVEQVLKRRQCNVLYPADLVPVGQKWQQEDFQALWLSIIAEMCSEVHMCKGWQFSNGGMEELVHVFQLKLGLPIHDTLFFYNTKSDEKTERTRMKNITVFDHRGHPITIIDAIHNIEEAKQWLERQSFVFPTEHHDICLKTLLWTQKKIQEGYYQ